MRQQEGVFLGVLLAQHCVGESVPLPLVQEALAASSGREASPLVLLVRLLDKGVLRNYVDGGVAIAPSASVPVLMTDDDINVLVEGIGAQSRTTQ